ncbi:unnamed protein product [Danaus chrysippus]|uniref:(African queen) hypothetical protein n=1 Tax=Danaus chrysippus TaxID=151541 RepID=A0A8J2VQU9_9NEOP|nr:unnamed protein product [Danaus chrysippus]
MLDFEKSDFVTKPTIQVPKPKVPKPDSLAGLVTLEEFMLQKQAEERQQLYSGRVLLGVERGARAAGRAAPGGAQGTAAGEGEGGELQRRLDRIVPDVIYGELAPEHRDRNKPISVPDKDGYETLVYPDERDGRTDSMVSGSSHGPHPAADSNVSSGVSRLRLMFGARRDLVRQESSRSEQYPHLQCPPTFQPETYSLARPPRDAHTRTHARD